MNTFVGSRLASLSRIVRVLPGRDSSLSQESRKAVCIMSNLTFRSRRTVDHLAASGIRAKRSGIGLTIGAAIGGSLLDAIVAPATAAPAPAALDPGEFLYGSAWYLQQFVQWIQDSTDTALRAYSLDSHQVYSIVLILSILAVFVCLMVKAFTLGRVAAERMWRDR